MYLLFFSVSLPCGRGCYSSYRVAAVGNYVAEVHRSDHTETAGYIYCGVGCLARHPVRRMDCRLVPGVLCNTDRGASTHALHGSNQRADCVRAETAGLLF